MEQDLWRYLKTVRKPIVLYGMGNGADKIIRVLNDFDIEISGVFATDGFVRDKYFHGFKLSSYSELKEKFGDMTVLLAFGSARKEVLNNIKRISSEQELFAPDVPVYGDTVFTSEYLDSNKDAFIDIYNRLADGISKSTFENTLRYKLSGRLDYLFDCAVPYDEPYEAFLKLGSNESYLDLGAYNGDTVADFVRRTDSYNKITAVEPDKKSFKKLLNNTADLNNFTAVNACTSAFDTTAEFSMRGGRNSSIGSGEKISCLTVDTLAKDGVSFIKADVEGEELNILRGAVNTISKYKPKLMLACYHRTEDLITLPTAVAAIRNDYRLYMRRFPCVPAWDTNYYFI